MAISTHLSLILNVSGLNALIKVYRVAVWFDDLNVRHETIKRLEDNIGETLFDINCSNAIYIGLLGSVSNAKYIKAKIKQKKNGT